jgi:hypothetical protein
MKNKIFNCEDFVITQNTKTDVISVEFFHARYFSLVQFELLEKEKNRFSEVKYINGLIDSYHKNRSNFMQKRKVTES